MISIGYTPVTDKLIEINLPLSKSISSRALILNYLSGFDLNLFKSSDADDTVLLKEKLKLITENIGSDKFTEININNAGTAMRFLTSLLSITKGNWILTGNERMQQRPIGDLVNALRLLGADIEHIGKNTYPPLKIRGCQISGGEVEIKSDASSQFVTSLLLISPFLKNGLVLNLKSKVNSLPYILMTLRMLSLKGVEYTFENNKISIPSVILKSTPIEIESDWSSASYFYEIFTFSQNSYLKLNGLKEDDIQGDAIISSVFENFGVQTDFVEDGIILSKSKQLTKDFNFDFSNYPDLAQTVAVTCAGLGIKAKLTGLDSLKFKETDRLSALYNELKKINSNVKIENNSLLIFPSNISTDVLLNSYNDHRMIMSFVPLAIVMGNIFLDDIKDVSKSFPNFWKEAKKMGLSFER